MRNLYKVVVPIALVSTVDGDIVHVEVEPDDPPVIFDLQTNDIIDHDGIYEAAMDFIGDLLAQMDATTRVAISEDFLGSLDGFTDDEIAQAIEAARLAAEQVLREHGFAVEVVVDDELARRHDTEHRYDSCDPHNDPECALGELWQQIIDRAAEVMNERSVDDPDEVPTVQTPDT